MDFLDDLNVPLASDKPLELQSFDWSWLDKKPGPVENLTLYLDDTVVTSLSGALADVKPDDLKASAGRAGKSRRRRGRGRGHSVETSRGDAAAAT